MTFSQKVKEAREGLHLNQQQLGDMAGVSKRSIAAYETSDTKPRGNVINKLAGALKVSADYLLNDEITNPKHGMEQDPFITEARERYGNQAAGEMDNLLVQNSAFFAGSSLNQEAKDAFFEAITKAYLACRGETRTACKRKN